MARLINIDNGSTLTDVCVIEAGRVLRTKVLTTPHDLSECFFAGLREASREVYGGEDVAALLRGADVIRYSTTQGTNALVERKGPRLGLLVDDAGLPPRLRAEGTEELFTVLVGDRVSAIDTGLDDDAFARILLQSVNDLTTAGANRLIVCFCGADFAAKELRAERILLARFPLHLLGSVPLLFSHEVTEDRSLVRRTWSALFNSFLHPSMEEFLYAAERRLRSHRIAAPLLIFRNDGGSARIAKTIAVKSYSSGPRGGMEGVRALAHHYGFENVVSLDVGGTTTDVGLVAGGEIRSRRRGRIEGVEVSFPLADIVSFGIAGSSVIRARGGEIRVGPESMGSVPGPACFARGGAEATITDAFLLMGVLDPATFFGGALSLDAERSRRAVSANVAEPLGLPLDQALLNVEEAWAGKIAEAIRSSVPISDRTVIVAFGGAGPMVVCRIAERLSVRRVIVPGLASVFSAAGIGFSDLSQEYEAELGDRSPEAVEAAVSECLRRAERDMFAERVALSECSVETSLVAATNGSACAFPYERGGPVPEGIRSYQEVALRLRVVKRLDHVPLAPVGGEQTSAAVARGARRILLDGRWRDVPVYRVEDQRPGASAEGPAIVEEAFFTGKVLPGWRFELTANRDLMLSQR